MLQKNVILKCTDKVWIEKVSATDRRCLWTLSRHSDLANSMMDGTFDLLKRLSFAVYIL